MERFKQLVENSTDLIYRYRLTDPRGFEYVNPASTAITGYTPEEHYADPDLGFKLVHPDDRHLLEAATQSTDPSPSSLVLRWIRRDGKTIWTEQRNTPVFDDCGKLVAIEGIARDVTEHTEALRRLQHLSRARDVITACNQLLVRSTDEASLLKGICRIIVETGGYRLAWIGFVEESSLRVLPVGSWGFEDGYLDGVEIIVGDPLRGVGPTGRAISSSQPVFIYNIETDPTYIPWREDATRRGFRSSIALPLIENGKAFGALNIYSAETAAFDAEEIRLLVELADDLAYGIRALRADSERRAAEDDVSKNSQLLSDSQRIAHVGSWQFDKQTGVISWTDETYRIYGVTPETFDHTKESFLKFYPPEDLAKLVEFIARLRNNQPTEPIDSRIIRPDGSERIIRHTGSSSVDSAGVVNFVFGTVQDVTHIKLISKDLEESEKRFRNIYENATIGLYRTTPEGRVLMANPAHIKQMGYETFEEFCVVHPEVHYTEGCSREDFIRLIEAEGTIRGVESAWKRRDGSTIYVRESARAVRDENGKTLYYEGTVEDITDQKLAEASLHESEQRYRLVFEGAGDYVLLLEFGSDGMLTIVDANDAALVIHGYSRDEMIGKPITLIDPEMTKEALLERKQLIEKESGATLLVHHVRKDGTRFDAEATVQTMSIGSKGFLLSIERDVTKHQQATLALQIAEIRYKEVVDNASDGIYYTDLEGRFQMANPATGRITGYSLEELAQMRYLDLVLPEHRNRVKRHYLRQFRSRESNTYIEFPILTKSGSIVWIGQIANLRYEHETAVGFHLVSRDITDRKRAEEALERERRLLTESQRIAHIGSWYMRIGAEKFVWTEEMYEIFGVTSDDFDLTPGSFLNLIHPDDREAMQNWINATYSGMKSAELTSRIIWPDGVMRYILGNGDPVFSSDGKLLEVIGTAQDITERVLAEEALREREKLYRLLADNVSDVIWMMDVNLNRTYTSPSVLKMRGYTCEEASQQPLEEMFTPSSLDLVKKTIAREFLSHDLVGDPNRSVTLELELLHKDGSIIWSEIKVSKIFNSDGKFIGILGVSRDIHQRKTAEQKLKDSEEMYRSIIDNALDAIFVRPLQRGEVTNFIEINLAACRMLGYSREELLSMSPLDIAPLGSREAVIKRAIKIEAESYVIEETVLLSKLGIVIPVEINAHSFLFKGKQMVVSVVRDISVRKQLETQLHQSQKMESVGQLAGGLAHDFNNLLTVISGHSDLLRLSSSPNDPMILDIDAIQKAADRATGLTRQLLAFSRKQTLTPKVLDLNAVIRDLEKMLRRLIREDITLKTEFGLDLWKVLVDPTQMEQILVNLTVNARDAMPDGGVLDIETSNVELDEAYVKNHAEASAGRFVMIVVSDTGIGMSSEIKDKIFEPFFTTKEVGKGTGLGLSTVFGIVKQSGGSIDVQSELGVGTSFKIYLPIAPDQAAETATSVQKLSGMPHGNETILVVEDEEAVRRVTVDVLERLGYKVIQASNGGEAYLLSKKMTKQVDLLVTDMVMPNMGGKELAQLVRGRWPTVKILFMSGYSADFVTNGGSLEAGSYYLSKPFRASVLATKVREVLDERWGS